MKLLPLIIACLAFAAITEADPRRLRKWKKISDKKRRRGQGRRGGRRGGGGARQALGRAANFGNDCDYISLTEVTSNSGCSNGFKFVLKGASGVRKQFVILNGKATLAFVTKGKKFAACTAYKDITSTITCKAVQGLANVDLAATAAPTVSGTTAAAVTTAAGTTAAGTTAAGATTAAGSCRCGIKKTSRIIGGSEASVNEYPWIAIFADANGDNQGGCSSTLIGDKWALTASHCFFDQSGNIVTTKDSMTVVLGIHDRTTTTETLRKVVKIAEIVTHPDYNRLTSQNDIALLRFTEAVDLNTYSPACLPAQGADFSGKNAWVYGWGVLVEGGNSLADKLQELEVPVVTDAVCQTALSGQSTITADMLCAGGVSGKDACQGDSGGPLTIDVNGKHTLIGDVSYGIGCGRDGLYGVYGEVAQFRTWIDSTITAKGGASFCN